LRVSIFNYNVGNLHSLQVAMKREGIQPQLSTSIRVAKTADALLLPGVGSFREAARRLPRDEIRDMAKEGKPILGICLGLQLFFDRSDEGSGKGLGLFRGEIRKLPSSVKVPQIGWNTLKIENRNEFVDQVPDSSWVYYVHSYYPSTQGRWVTATTEYGVKYHTIVSEKNILGTQFHPEKSGTTGRTILQNFLRSLKG
jgi:glutamine amidotransferase